ncbi:ABC transporter permease [Rhizobium leguminosarum]|uniref:ABC transporter permease n=1 Tax=Rhizobium leguminosarum TaxID=384 RepID=UPI001C94A9AF|nr:ABC transporter permease [Rhizobium leguminosarum]MBY5775361.1 ABC transporter permease [Rhizobium leguminosarum]
MSIVISKSPAVRARPRRAVGGYVPLVAPITVLLIFFAIPIGMMIGISFQDPKTLAWSLVSYERFFTDNLIVAGLFRTILMSGLVAVCVTAMAYPVGYYLARSTSRWRAVIFALAIAPELAGVVLRTYGWLIILEDRGFINDALIWSGFISAPIPLAKNLFGVVVGLSHVVLPFGILAILTSIQGIDPNLEKAAQVLGASRLSVIRHVLLPLSVPGVVSSLLISFTMAASAYATPALLGGARFKVLATMIYEQIMFFTDWPMAAVMAMVLLIVMLAFSFVGTRTEARLHKKLNV